MIKLVGKLYAKAYFTAGKYYFSKKNFDESINNLDLAIKYNPNEGDYYNFRGYTYAEKHDYNRAILDYDKAIKLSPSLAVAYNNKGLAYYKLNKIQLAKENFRKASGLGLKIAKRNLNDLR
ncbi:MAG: tetratricopeptide repeat protein [Elusimicrobia bacterium]|nr:tetratricopeptide repeat protein [Candidatus Liberimonas magnetica]